MFWNKKFKIDKKMIPNMRPTSKAALKTMCLMSANGDIDKAERLYDFMIKDMDELPLFDIPEPTVMDQVKSSMSDTWQWFNQNQDQVMGVVDMIKSLLNKGRGGGMPPAAPLNQVPPIN